MIKINSCMIDLSTKINNIFEMNDNLGERKFEKKCVLPGTEIRIKMRKIVENQECIIQDIFGSFFLRLSNIVYMNRSQVI